MDSQLTDLLQRFAEIPPASEESQQVAEQLAALVAAVQGLLASDDPEIRLLAASALARLDPDTALVSILVEGLRSDDEAHQVYAAYACRCLGDLAAEAVPSLIEVVQQEDHDTAAYHAIQAIEAVGPAAANAVPVLVEILRGVGPDASGNKVLLALGAVAALGAIGDRAAIPALQACLGLEGDELIDMVREEAAKALTKLEE
jgi:HEAT repeat protein